MAGPTPGIGNWNLTGETLSGRYRVEGELGAGGMATVYSAMDQTLGRKVVIKIPHAELLQQSGFRERFIEEVRALIKLVHPHILPIQDYGEYEGVPFAVVAYFSGGDLRSRIAAAGGRIGVAEVQQWLPQIASALDFMHSKGTVHRDIKPDNILFDEQGNVLLSDFGIATVMQDFATEDTLAPQLTRVGAFVGTTAYAPPEAIRRELSGAYDQYSLGVTLYYALSGEMPFRAATPEETLVLKSSQEARPIGEIAPDLPSEVASVIMRSIALDADRRFPSCVAFADALLAAGGPTTSATAGWMGWAALAAGVVAIGLAAALLVRDEAVEVKVVPADPPGTRFEAGSTPEEISAAMVLCEQHAGECDVRDFESEILREVRILDLVPDRTEVTNADFLKFVEATDHITTAEATGVSYYQGVLERRGWTWRNVDGSGATSALDHPVIHVSQQDATAYCAWVGGRLPSEVEWEFIARGVERRAYPWGNDWDAARVHWKSGGAAAGVEPVGRRTEGETPEGLQDLAGNVWEWTSSRTNAGKAVLKGGAWATDNPAYLRAAMRLDEAPDFSSDDVGFRCVREPDAS